MTEHDAPTTGRTASLDTCSRRGVLRTAAVVAGAGVAGCAGALDGSGDAGAGAAPAGRTDWSEGTDVGGGRARTFVATADGAIDAVGVRFGAGVLDGLPAEPPEGGGHHHSHLHLPDADTGAFEWVGMDWNPEGHLPPGVYDVPHLDFHFYTIGHDAVESIPGPRPAPYELPDDQLPEGYVRPPAVDTDDDGEPDAPLIVPAMGEHLMNTSAPEFGDEPFTHTHIWGAYDPALLESASGDGVGELTFMEPMVTTAFFEELEEAVVSSIGMPAAFPEAGRYPTEYAVRYLADEDAYAVSLEGFERFETSSGG